MASLTKAINKELFDSILPAFGNPRKAIPVWDNEQKMFICDEYNSGNGHCYYKGIRFCENIVIVEKVGLFHNWIYIDGIELYVFNGTRLELMQKKDYDKVFRNEEFIRNESEQMLRDVLSAYVKMQKPVVSVEDIAMKAKAMVEACYKSFLDSDYSARLTQILPQIEQR